MLDEIQEYSGKSLENKATHAVCCMWQARNGPKGKQAMIRDGENKVGQIGSMTLGDAFGICLEAENQCLITFFT